MGLVSVIERPQMYTNGDFGRRRPKIAGKLVQVSSVRPLERRVQPSSRPRRGELRLHLTDMRPQGAAAERTPCEQCSCGWMVS